MTVPSPDPEERAMFQSKKILTAALVATTIAVAGVASVGTAQAFPPPHPHHHHHHGGPAWGWGVGGLATGLVIGSALAQRPVAYEEPVRRCMIVERVNRWGDVVGTRRVCRYE